MPLERRRHLWLSHRSVAVIQILLNAVSTTSSSVAVVQILSKNDIAICSCRTDPLQELLHCGLKVIDGVPQSLLIMIS